MNIENLDQAFVELIEKKVSFLDSKTPASTPDIHERNFFAEFGDQISEILFNVYDEYCPDNEVMPLHHYLAQGYRLVNGQYEVDRQQGVPVEADDFPGVYGRLVLMPSPTRLVLMSSVSDLSEIVWQFSREKAAH